MNLERLNPVDLAVPLFFALMAVEIGLGRLKRRRYYRLNDTISDLSTSLIFGLVGLGAVALGLVAYESIRLNFSLAPLLGYEDATLDSPWYVWLLALIGVDFLYYWFHRATHDVRLFWCFHVTHHSSEEFNLSVALRQCAFQRLLEYPFNFPLALLGVPWQMFLICHGILKVYQFWVHTRWIGKLGPLEYVILTPSHHRVHHGRDPLYLDRNHGGILIIWDRLFGTYVEEKEEPHYGLTKPLQTLNPLTANLHAFQEIWSDFRRTSGLKNKLGVLFRKPGWRPPDLGGPLALADVPASYQKYDPSISGASAYLLVQFLVTVAATLLVLRWVKQAFLPLPYALLISVLVIYSLGSIGLMLDGRRSALFWEPARYVLLGVVALCLFSVGLMGQAAALAAFSMAGAFWFMLLRNRLPLGPSLQS